MPAARRPYAPRMAPEARREQLLDAAITVIARDGYADLSIEAIAREAGVTRPVVYGAFAGLQPLLLALLDRQEARALRQLTAALPSDLTAAAPDALAVATIRRLVEVVQGDPLTWKPILAAPEGTPAAVRERIARDRELVRGRVAALVAAALAARGGPELDPEVVAHTLVAAAEHFGRLLLTEPDRFDADRLAETAQRLLALLPA